MPFLPFQFQLFQLFQFSASHHGYLRIVSIWNILYIYKYIIRCFYKEGRGGSDGNWNNWNNWNEQDVLGTRRGLCFMTDKTMLFDGLKYELALLTKRGRRSCWKSDLIATRNLVVSENCCTFAPSFRDTTPHWFHGMARVNQSSFITNQ